MEETYFHSDEVVVRTAARSCYELVLAVRRYGQWWREVRCEPLGPEAQLRVGSRFRFSGGPMSWVIEVTGLHPWRRIDLRYAEGALLGPVSWEFLQRGESTLVRYAYRGVQPNSDYTRRSFASGQALKRHSDAMQRDAFAGMRRLLETGCDVTGGDLFEAMHTQRSVRRFRPDPVPNSVLRQVLEAATRAPSARNAQPWYFVAVRDRNMRRTIGELYLQAWQCAEAYTATTDADGDIKDRPGYAAMMQAVDKLARHLDSAPVLVLACLDTTQLGPMADRSGGIVAPLPAYASIFPAVQNLMLAARGLGLGSTLTTLHAIVEAEIRAAIGIPPHVHIAALVPLGYPMRPFRTPRRKPVDAVAFLDRWGAPLS
ncbi:MAG: nitroreductase family protein [Candidatus Binatia bacterium]